jgi:hypothetical protein
MPLSLSLCLSLTLYHLRGIVGLLQLFSSQCTLSVDPLDYICFYSLRAWDVLEGKVMTEEIYVRSKVTPHSLSLFIVSQDSSPSLICQDHDRGRPGGDDWQLADFRLGSSVQ